MRFEFPDIASHPACADLPTFEDEEGKLSTDISTAQSLGRIMQNLPVLIRSLGNFDATESMIFDEQMRRLAATEVAWQYLAANWGKVRGGVPSFGETGISHVCVDTTDLRLFFERDIVTLLAHTPPDPLPINEIDRVKTRIDETARRVVSRFLEATGLLPRARAYANRNIDVVAVTVMVASPGDQHHYQTFRDIETVPKLLNLHQDPKPGILKALIYLSDVGPDDGPFEFIKGSAGWRYDRIARVFAWGNSVGNYCHTPAHRRVACMFPKRFRGSAIVGRLIPDGSELSDTLLKALTTYHSADATAFVFDPCFNFHRGGQCKSGARYTLNVVLK